MMKTAHIAELRDAVTAAVGPDTALLTRYARRIHI
jgi:hypothetical protein